MDKLELTLNSPLTEEQMDAISDVDFDNTSRIWFNTKHGKIVEFVKQKHGKWEEISHGCSYDWGTCTYCNARVGMMFAYNFCPNCGADMREES